jgi:hypothetical protein
MVIGKRFSVRQLHFHHNRELKKLGQNARLKSDYQPLARTRSSVRWNRKGERTSWSHLISYSLDA